MSYTMPVHSLASTRTMLVGVFGFGSAALVTSLSVLAAESTEAAAFVATVGGEIVLGVAAVVVAVCAGLVRQTGERPFWAAVAVGLALTTVGSALRASTLFSFHSAGPSAGAPEGLYVAGLLVLAGTATAWLWAHRDGRSLALPFAISVAGTTSLAAAFWLVVGRRMVEAAFTSDGIGPAQVQGYLGFLMFIVAVAVFALAGSVYLRSDPRVVAQMLLAAGLLMMVAGDVIWVVRMATQPAWSPGSFGDFLHIASNGVVAVAASFALDVDRATRDGKVPGATMR